MSSGGRLRTRLARIPRRRSAGALVAGLLVVLGATIVLLHVYEYPTISPIDELQHIDYALKVSKGELVRRGDRVGQVAMREEACRGIENFPPPPCNRSRYRPHDFQEEGYNTAYIHPPTFYLIDGVIAHGLQKLPGTHSFVGVGRDVGVLWLGAAILLIWALLGEFSVPFPARAVLIVLAISTPTVIHMSATMNPDGAGLALGAALLWATVRWERGSMHWAVPVVLAGLCIAFKSTFAVAVGLCILYLISREIQRRFGSATEQHEPDEQGRAPRHRDYVRLACALLLSVVVVSVIWVGVQTAIARVDPHQIPIVQRFEVKAFPTEQLRLQLFAGVTPLQFVYAPAFLRTTAVHNLTDFVDVSLIVLGVAGALLADRGSRLRALGIATLITMLVVGPLFVVVNYLTSHTFVAVPPRYGLAMVPGLLVVCAIPLRYKPVLLASGALALGFATLTLVRLTTA